MPKVDYAACFMRYNSYGTFYRVNHHTGAMKLFLDSADPKEIAKLAATGLVDGVTTNPSLAAKTGRRLCRSR